MFKHIRLHLATVIGVGILALTSVPKLAADDFNKKTVMTFNAPVEISGQVLPAGKYVFETLSDDRNIVVVRNSEENQVMGVFRTIEIVTPQVYDDTHIDMSEGAANSPEIVHAWFYPGETIGWEFLPGSR